MSGIAGSTLPGTEQAGVAEGGSSPPRARRRFPKIPLPAWYLRKAREYSWSFGGRKNLTELEAEHAYSAALRDQIEQMRCEIDALHSELDRAQAEAIILEQERRMAQERALRAVRASRTEHLVLQIGEPPDETTMLSAQRLQELLLWAQREHDARQRLVNESFRHKVTQHAEAHIEVRERWGQLIGLLTNAVAVAAVREEAPKERAQDPGGPAPEYTLQSEFVQEGFRVRVERENRMYPYRRVTAVGRGLTYGETVSWIDWEGSCGGKSWISPFLKRAQARQAELRGTVSP